MLNVKPARNGVFISYARSDGEEFANLLRQRLETEKIPLWQDRIGMEGGYGWWRQITEALDKVEFMTLVVTPNAVQSDTVRKEWRYARQQGVCVYPIKGESDLQFKNLPHWMSSAHFYDLGTVENGLNGPEWPKFVNDLKTRCQIRRAPFMVANLPEGFVRRTTEFDRLLKLLCDERRGESFAITAALRGAGGYGKTTLAEALCHDQRIQDVFFDGILWVKLGENPGNLTGQIEDLIVTLGDERPGFITLDAAVNRFKELLGDRNILLVIDDVWDRAHLNPFMQGGPRCGRLITTRNFDTLPASVIKVQVDAMQPKEATELLTVGLDHVAHDRTLSDQLNELASRLGEWPLLLGLVSSALRRRIENDQQSPIEAVRWVNTALTKRGLTYFDADNSESRRQTVAGTLAVSMELLSNQDRERYGELAVFPENVEIPLDTVEKLWQRSGGLDGFDTDDLCRRLNSYSLLRSYDARRKSIRLHGVIRNYLVEQQGRNLTTLSDLLLETLRPPSSSTDVSLWSEMAESEPYLWDQLAYHLWKAGRGDELIATVKDWRYLIAKTLTRKSFSVEADFVLAEKIAGHDDMLRLLRRNFVNSGHMLSRCEKKEDIKITLFSRLLHLPELSSLTTDLKKNLKRPCLVPAGTLPDLPHPALIRTLSGHGGSVIACAVSADASTIVSASEDETLKVWDGRNGAERFSLSRHEGRVFACAVSADGSTIVSAGADRTLKVWDGRSGTERFTLSGHSGPVLGCAVSADGLVIVSASEDHTLKVWEGRTGVERFMLSGHAGIVSDCAISADGTTIVSASEDHTLKVWDGQNGAELSTLVGHTGWIRGCAISADGKTIVSASEDGTVKVWDAKVGEYQRTLSGHADWVRSCAVSADGSIIVSASDDQTLKVWDSWSGAEVLTLSGHAGLVFGCAMSFDGTTIVSASEDQMLKVWDVQHREEDSSFKASRGIVLGCAITADGTTVVSTSEDQTLKVWDELTGVERFTLTGHVAAINGCAVSADGAIIVSASDDQTLKVWDARSGTERFTLIGHDDVVNSCAVSADGLVIVSASSDRTLKIWDGRNGIERFTLTGHMDSVVGCAVSGDGATIVSAGEDQTVRVWDASDGGERFEFDTVALWGGDCAVSVDGGTIVSAENHTLRVWDGHSGVELLTLDGHTDEVKGCAVSADGALVISAAEDQTLRVWDGRTGACLSTLHVDGDLYGCDCSADGEIIAAAGARGIYFLRLVR